MNAVLLAALGMLLALAGLSVPLLAHVRRADRLAARLQAWRAAQTDGVAEEPPAA